MKSLARVLLITVAIALTSGVAAAQKSRRLPNAKTLVCFPSKELRPNEGERRGPCFAGTEPQSLAVEILGGVAGVFPDRGSRQS